MDLVLCTLAACQATTYFTSGTKDSTIVKGAVVVAMLLVMVVLGTCLVGLYQVLRRAEPSPTTNTNHDHESKGTIIGFNASLRVELNAESNSLRECQLTL